MGVNSEVGTQIGGVVNLDPVYTGLVTMVQVLYQLEICCRGWVFIILYDEV